MILNFKKIGLLLLFIPISVFGIGQSDHNVVFSNILKKDGLPSNQINAVDTDSLGFLWIATDNGLCRYDGPSQIKVYNKAEKANAPDAGLQSNTIRSLYCGTNGYIWIGTKYGGLTRFHHAKNEWKTFRHNSHNSNSLSNDDVLSILEDSKKRIWIGTESGLNLYNPKTDAFTRFKLGNSNIDQIEKPVLDIYEDKNGGIWIGTWDGDLHLLLTDNEGAFISNQSRQFKIRNDKGAKNVWSIFQDKQNRIWVGTHGGGLFLMNFSGDYSNNIRQQDWDVEFQKCKFEWEQSTVLVPNAIQAICEDETGDIWIGTTNGLFRMPYNSDTPSNSKREIILNLECFLSTNERENSIVCNTINNLYKDDQGLIWIATSSGLSQFNKHSNQFKSLFYPDNLVSDFNSAPCFFTDNHDDFWFGTLRNGLVKYSIIDGVWQEHDIDLNQFILGERVTTLFSPDRNWIYAATEKGVTALELETFKVKTYPIPEWIKSIINDFVVVSLFVDDNDFIWLGTKFGLFRINQSTKVYTHYEPDANDPNSISDHPVNHIIQDKEGKVWVATYKGLNRIMNPAEDKLVFKKFFYNNEKPNLGPISNAITYLKELDDILYIGTLSGMCSYDFKTENFEHFNAHKTWVLSFEEGLENELWLSTNDGIARFDLLNKSLCAYDKKDGLEATNFSLGSSAKNTSGDIYFGDANGLVCFSPLKLENNKEAPSVYVTGYETMTPYSTVSKDCIYDNQIVLNHDDYRLSINFAALNYYRPDKNQYVYRLLGFENQWNEAKMGTPIVYTNLQPKEYTLEVKASNNDGVWNEEGASITIIQQPAYWETLWFQFLVSIFFIAIVFGGISWYINKIQKHNEALQVFNKNLSLEIENRKIAEQKLSNYNRELRRSNHDLEQFAYIASHDLKEPLRVIGSFSGLLKRKLDVETDSETKEYFYFIEDGVKRMSQLISSLLTYSTVGQKDSQYDKINLEELVKSKLADLHQSIKEKNALVRIERLPDIIGHKQQIGMVFFNLVHNAIKFNENENPVITVAEEKGGIDYWVFSVKDNGIGIEPEYKDRIFGVFKRLHGKGEYEGTGIGLSVCHKVITRHRGKIWMKSKLGEGTTFYFSIKKNLHLQDEEVSRKAAVFLEKN